MPALALPRAMTVSGSHIKRQQQPVPITQPQRQHSVDRQLTHAAEERVPEAVRAILKLTATARGCGRERGCVFASDSGMSNGPKLATTEGATTAGASQATAAIVIAAPAALPTGPVTIHPNPKTSLAYTHKRGGGADVCAASQAATATSRHGPDSGSVPAATFTANGAMGSLTISSTGSKGTPRSIKVSAASSRSSGSYSGGSSSLKAPVGLSRCTIVEDAPFPPPNTQVVMELHERTLRLGSRRLRYRGYRPADRTLPWPPPPVPGSWGGGAGADDATGPHASPYAFPQHHHSQHLRAPGSALANHEALNYSRVLALPAAAAQAAGSLHHHLSLSIKVPWAQPSALPARGGGLLESLNEALSNGSGYMVVGAAVRPGCILLQVDLLATSAPGTSAPGASLLRSFEVAAGEGAEGPDGRGGSQGRGGGGGDALAAQLARQVSTLAPPPPSEGSEVLISLGGRLSYALLYDDPTAEWTATALDGADGGGGGDRTKGPAALLWRLGGQRGVRLWSALPAVVVPAAAAVGADWGGCEEVAPPSLPLVLTLQVEVADDAAAVLLAEQLAPLLLVTQQEAEDHEGLEGWQLVANCLGRSLPVSVLQVVAAGRGSGNAGGGGALMTGSGWHCTEAAAVATVSVKIAVGGSREALEAVCCRLAVLSLELWYGMQEVAQVPVMMVHDSIALPPQLRPPGRPTPTSPSGATDGTTTTTAAAATTNTAAAASSAGALAGGRVVGRAFDAGGAAAADAVAAELCGLAVAAVAGAEDDQCARQLFADLGTLELYVASQCKGTAAPRKEPTSDGGDAAAASVTGRQPPSRPLPWSFGGAGPDEGQEPLEEEAVEGEMGAGASPAPLFLPGSLDLSQQLQQLLSQADLQQRQTMILTGANLLSYTVLRAMSYTANAVREGLASLGCGLAEADELSAAAGGGTEDGVVGGDGHEYDDHNGDGEADVPCLRPSASWDDADLDDPSDAGLPMVHLAVLSGNLRMVHLVLAWAAEEGLGPAWVLRRHRGSSPLQVAAAAAEDSGSGGAGVGVHAAYLAQVELLLPREPRDDSCSDQSEATEAAEPQQELMPPPLPPRRRPPRPEGSADGGAPTEAAEAPLAAARGPGPESACGGFCISRWNVSTGVAAYRGSETTSTPTTPPPRAEPKLSYTRTTSPASTDATAGAVAPPRSRPPSRRHPLLVYLLGDADPAVEASFRRFVLPYDAQVVAYWAPLMCFLLASALLRRLRGQADPAETPVSLLFAWPYVALVAGLVLCPSVVYRNLPTWWLLCGLARLYIKPLCAAGLLAMPGSMLAYTRRGMTLVADTMLPGLCERVPGLPGLAIRLLDVAAHVWFLLDNDLAATPAAAVLHALMRAGIFLGCSLAVELRHRARFEAAAAAAAAAAATGGAAGMRHEPHGTRTGPVATAIGSVKLSGGNQFQPVDKASLVQAEEEVMAAAW